MDRRSWIAVVIIAAAAVAAAIALSVSGDNTPQALPTTTAAAEIAPTTTTTSPPPETTTTTSRPPETTSTLTAGSTVCDRYESISVAGMVASPALFEASGIAASRNEPGVVWAHNDSGDQPTLYAVGANGEDLATVTLEGIAAFDWEDLAAGPGPERGRSYLYVGDIGDNFGIRDGSVTVHRIEEPDPGITTSAVVERTFDLETPDGPQDFEALFVADGLIYLVSKDTRTTRVYRMSSADGERTVPMELVATLELGAEVTAADVSWDGSMIAFRGYQTIWMWHRPEGVTVADAIAAEPCTAPSPDEEQGEAIAFLENGTIITVSEGTNPDLHAIAAVR